MWAKDPHYIYLHWSSSPYHTQNIYWGMICYKTGQVPQSASATGNYWAKGYKRLPMPISDPGGCSIDMSTFLLRGSAWIHVWFTYSRHS